MHRILSIAFTFALLVAACSGAADEQPSSTTAAPTTEATAPTTASTTTTTTTIAPTTTTTTTTTAGDTTGSRDNPVPAGETVRIGDWEITVVAATPDATEDILAENTFNDPPPEGHQSFLVGIVARYVGTESDYLSTLAFSSVGDGAVAYDFGDWCGVIPAELDAFKEVFPGGTLSGNMCWQVASSDAESLVLIIKEIFVDTRVIFEIPPDGVVLEPPPGDPVPVSGGDVGTRGNPTPLGDVVRVGDWEVVVLGATPDATDLVLAENSFNEPPNEGYQSFLVEVSATYVGRESEALFESIDFTAVGASAVAYTDVDWCGVTPDELDTFAEVFPGGTLSGTLCWHVATDDVPSLVLLVDVPFSTDDERAFMALPTEG